MSIEIIFIVNLRGIYMFKKVLISSDLSDASNALLACSVSLKNIGVEEAVLGHILQYDTIPGRMNETFEKETVIMDKDHELLKDLMPLLEKQQAILEEAGIKATIEVAHGIPARAINDLAEKHEVSAIVTGSHGKGILKRVAMGSVSSQLLGLTRKPVFLFRVNIGKNFEAVMSCKRLFNHILYLTDFSEIAQKSLDYLEQIVKHSKSSVTILHIHDFIEAKAYIYKAPDVNPRYFEKVEADIPEEVQSDLEAIKKRLLAAGSPTVNIEYKKGVPKYTALEYIEEQDELTLVVMGSQGKGFVKELFIGSLSLEISRNSPIPVLLIPAKV